MKKKIIAIGIICMFLLSSVASVSAVVTKIDGSEKLFIFKKTYTDNSPNSNEYDYPDFKAYMWYHFFPGNSFIPGIALCVLNRGADFEENIPIYVACFLDNDEVPFHVFEYQLYPWRNQERLWSEEYEIVEFPPDLEQHNITFVIDYTNAVYEGIEGECNNNVNFSMKDPKGVVLGLITNIRGEPIKGLTVRVKGVNNEFEGEVVTGDQHDYNYVIMDIPFGECIVTVEKDGKILKSKKVEIKTPPEWRIVLVSFNILNSRKINRPMLNNLFLLELSRQCPRVNLILRLLLRL